MESVSQNRARREWKRELPLITALFSTDNRLVHQKTTISTALILSRLALASGAQMLYLEVS
jgi:hypothetical protein